MKKILLPVSDSLKARLESKTGAKAMRSRLRSPGVGGGRYAWEGWSAVRR